MFWAVLKWKIMSKFLKIVLCNEILSWIEMENHVKISYIVLCNHVWSHLKGDRSTPIEEMIFYLWTDSNEICTSYVKLKINDTFISWKIFDFLFSIWENYDFHVFEGYF